MSRYKTAKPDKCFLQTAIFQDFAGEAVNLCRQSLTTASEKIAARPGASKLDGQLFVIRHLLILKEMVRSMDLVQIERAMDFTNMTGKIASRDDGITADC